MFRKGVHILFFLLIVAMLFSFAGCSRRSGTGGSTAADINAVVTPKQSDIFMTTGFRIKTNITPQTVTTFDPLIFEVYVDGKGNGTGLVSYKDKVYDVVITADQLYIKVATNTAVQITDFTGHIIPSSVKISGSDNLTSLGFGMLDGRVASYKYSDNYFIVDGTYILSDSTFEPSTITAGNMMTLTETINYILSMDSTGYQASQQPTASQSEAFQQMTEKGSFWNNSWLGVKIHDTTYSIGDYCNPVTYFERTTPESLAPTYTYNADDRVEMLHISYQSSDGRTSFMTTEGYVQTITTTSPFQWYTLSDSISAKELKELLGIGLSKKKLEEFTPILAGLEMVSSKGNKYVLKYLDLEITIGVDNSKDCITSFAISRPVNFD